MVGNSTPRLDHIQGYKDNRRGNVRPIHYKRLKEILVSEWKAVLVEGQEADDSLAMAQTQIIKDYGDLTHSTIVSIDKTKECCWVGRIGDNPFGDGAAF